MRLNGSWTWYSVWNKQIYTFSLTEFEAKTRLSEGNRRDKMDQKLWNQWEENVQTAAARVDLLLNRKKVWKEGMLYGGWASGARLGGPQVGVVCVSVCVCVSSLRAVTLGMRVQKVCACSCTCYAVSSRLGTWACGCWDKSKGVFDCSTLVWSLEVLREDTVQKLCVCVVCVYDSYKGTEISLSWAVNVLCMLQTSWKAGGKKAEVRQK